MRTLGDGRVEAVATVCLFTYSLISLFISTFSQ